MSEKKEDTDQTYLDRIAAWAASADVGKVIEEADRKGAANVAPFRSAQSIDPDLLRRKFTH